MVTGDNDLELNIELNADQAEAGTRKLREFEKAWLHLASLPTIDFSQKFKVPSTTTVGATNQAVLSGLGIGQSSTAEGHRAAVEAVKKGQTRVKELSYSWDSLYKTELAFVKDRKKKKQFLSMMEKEAFQSMRSDPASSTGKYHPDQMNKEGGLVQHSRAVAQGALGLAQVYKYKGDTDDLVLQGLGHDMKKKGANGFYNLKHAEEAAEVYKRYGLEGSGVKTHMGMFAGGSRTAEAAVSFEQKLIKEADWLASRSYAGDYLAFDKKGKLKTGYVEDWKGLRKRAIKEGDAKATGLFGKGFLKVIDEEEDKKAKNAKKYENSYHSALVSAGKLYQVLKKIAMLGVGALFIGIKESEATAALMSSGMSAFTGTTMGQTMSNELREHKASLGKGSINAAVTRLNAQRGQFKLTGAGELLPLAMARTIESMMTGERPMQEVYGEVVDMFTQQLRGAKTQSERDKLLALVGSTLGPEAVSLVNTQATLSTNWTGLGARMGAGNDPYGYGPGAISRNAEMQTSLNGITDAWRDFFGGFMELFGNPFLQWLAELMQYLTTLRGLTAFFSNYSADVGSQNRAAEAYTKLAGNTHGAGLGLLAKEYDEETRGAGRAYDMGRGEQLRKLRAATVQEMSMPQRIAEANRLLGLTGDNALLPTTPYVMFADFLRRVQEKERQEAMDRAAGIYTGDYGVFSLLHPMTRNTAKVYSAFSKNFANDRGMAGTLGNLAKLKELTNPARFPSGIDTNLTQSLEMYQAEPNAANKALLDAIINEYLQIQARKEAEEAAKARERDVSMAPTIQINNSFPGVTNAAEISRAVGTMPSAVENAYNNLYVERG